MGDQRTASSWHHDKGEKGGDARVRKQHPQRSWTSGWHQETGAGLPWWLRGKKSACQCRRQKFDPWPREIPHAVELLNPWARVTAAHVPWTPQQWEACAPQLESSPCSQQLEKNPSGNEEPVQQKINKLIKKKETLSRLALGAEGEGGWRRQSFKATWQAGDSMKVFKCRPLQPASSF